MAARSGMANIITELRRLTNATTGDTQIENQDYWTDDVLQDILDKSVVEYHHVPMVARPKVVLNNAIEYYDYIWDESIGVWLETPDTSGAFYVQNYLGAEQAYGVAYTVDYTSRKVSFIANTGGRTYYLTCRSYDINAAAAQVWLDKAAHRAEYVSFTVDNHRVEEDQEWDHCIKMYRYYSSRAGFKTTRMRVVDFTGVRKHAGSWRW